MSTASPRAARVPRRDWPSVSVLHQIDAVDRDALLSLGVTREFAGGLPIIVEGTAGSVVFIVLKGYVKVVGETAAGHQTVLAIRSRGEIVGELAVLDGGLRSSTVLAAGRLLVRAIDGGRFRAFLRERPQVADALQRSVMAKLRRATDLRVAVGSASVLARLARTIEHLAEGYGRPVTDGILIDLPVTREDLASLIGVSDKGVRRSIRTLTDADAILAGYRQVIIRDVGLLHSYADADTDADGDTG
jgi:CRP/FNR family cyclic AMP-dependent transcriptional regulator